MNTRHAKDDSVFRQERYASSPVYEKGLTANLVAKRCGVLDSAEQREMIYFLQYLSHSEGLSKVASDILGLFADQFATSSMVQFGVSARGKYSAEQVRQIRAEMPYGKIAFPLKDDVDAGDSLLRALTESVEEDWCADMRPVQASETKDTRPKSYPVAVFQERCVTAAKTELEKFFQELCTNPAIRFGKDAPWYCALIFELLEEYKAAWTEPRQKEFVCTELGKLVWETLEYSLHGNCLALIDGRARTGKSFSAKKWVELHCGRARFVEMPVGNSDSGFFRAIAEALGVSINLNSKAHELRDRIEYVLRTGDLMLVFDEAHHAWPDSMNREALPFRVSWIMSMVNAGVPISLIVTQQFFAMQKRTERRSGWNSAQFIGRNGFYQPLPEKLSESDLCAVAKSLLPEAGANSIELLVKTAMMSEKYLAGIEFTVKRARYLANKSGREKVLISDLQRAITEGVIPSDKAFAQVLAKPEKSNSRSARRDFPPLRELPAPAPRKTDPILKTAIPQRESQPFVAV